MGTGFNLRARDGFTATEILSVPPGLHLRRGAGRPRSAGSARPQGQQCDAESPGNSSPTGLTTASPRVALTWAALPPSASAHPPPIGDPSPDPVASECKPRSPDLRRFGGGSHADVGPVVGAGIAAVVVS